MKAELEATQKILSKLFVKIGSHLKKSWGWYFLAIVALVNGESILSFLWIALFQLYTWFLDGVDMLRSPLSLLSILDILGLMVRVGVILVITAVLIGVVSTFRESEEEEFY